MYADVGMPEVEHLVFHGLCFGQILIRLFRFSSQQIRGLLVVLLFEFVQLFDLVHDLKLKSKLKRETKGPVFGRQFPMQLATRSNGMGSEESKVND